MLQQPIPDAQRLHDAALPAFFRPRDAVAAGIPYGHLRRMEDAGLVEREGWGLYWRTDADITEHHTVAAGLCPGAERDRLPSHRPGGPRHRDPGTVGDLDRDPPRRPDTIDGQRQP